MSFGETSQTIQLTIQFILPVILCLVIWQFSFSSFFLSQLYTLLLFYILFIYFFLAVLHGMWHLISPTRDWTCAPLQWKRAVLTTGPPENSLPVFLIKLTGVIFCCFDESSTVIWHVNIRGSWVKILWDVSVLSSLLFCKSISISK